MEKDWFLDWNTLSLDQMAEYLENKYRFSSTGEALCIDKLIEFYHSHKDDDKQWYVVRRNNCGTIDPNGKADTDILGITTNLKLCKERESVFCKFEKVNIIEK